MLDLYKNIKSLRKENKWTQEELALRLGYTDRSTIAKIEAGKVDLPRSKIIAFAQVFGVSPGDLLGNVEEPESPEEQLIKANERGFFIRSITDEELELIKRYRKSSPEAQGIIRKILGYES